MIGVFDLGEGAVRVVLGHGAGNEWEEVLVDGDVATLLHEVFSDEDVVAFLVENVEGAVVDVCAGCCSKRDVDVSSQCADGGQRWSCTRGDGEDGDRVASFDGDVWAVVESLCNV